MKVLIDIEILQKYLPENELVKITEAARAKRDNHRNKMRKWRDNHKAENGEFFPKTAVSVENSGENHTHGGEGGVLYLNNDHVRTDSTSTQDTLSLKKENLKEKNVTKKEKKSCENHKTELEKCRDAFWEIWPKHFRKTDKAGTLNAMAKAFRENKDLGIDRLLKAVEWWKNSDQWKKDNGQYIPEPRVWLNKRKWEVLENIPAAEKRAPAFAAPPEEERGPADMKFFFEGLEKLRKENAEAK
jgi:hypothetical protein